MANLVRFNLLFLLLKKTTNVLKSERAKCQNKCWFLSMMTKWLNVVKWMWRPRWTRTRPISDRLKTWNEWKLLSNNWSKMVTVDYSPIISSLNVQISMIWVVKCRNYFFRHSMKATRGHKRFLCNLAWPKKIFDADSKLLHSYWRKLLERHWTIVYLKSVALWNCAKGIYENLKFAGIKIIKIQIISNL